jgi:hypothetical protein
MKCDIDAIVAAAVAGRWGAGGFRAERFQGSELRRVGNSPKFANCGRIGTPVDDTLKNRPPG